MKDWILAFVLGLSVLMLGGCLDQQAPPNVDPAEWQSLQSEMRVRTVRLAILAAEADGKLDPDQAALLNERAVDVLNCIQKKPECKIADLPNANDPLVRMKLFNVLMERLEEDLQQKIKEKG